MHDPFAPAPLIVSLTLDAASQAWFDALRTAHFPPDRLQVSAHVTMFHALPGAQEPEVAARMVAICAEATPFEVQVTGLRFLGRGVAFKLSAPPAAALRARLAAGLNLTSQDAAAWSPPHYHSEQGFTRRSAANPGAAGGVDRTHADHRHGPVVVAIPWWPMGDRSALCLRTSRGA